MRVIDELVDGFRHGLLAAKLAARVSDKPSGSCGEIFWERCAKHKSRSLRLVGIEAAPHVDVDVQVVFDVDRRETDAHTARAEAPRAVFAMAAFRVCKALGTTAIAANAASITAMQNASVLSMAYS